MKKAAIFLLFVGILGFGAPQLRAQDIMDEKKDGLLQEGEEGPLIYKFEPDFLASIEQRRAKIEKMRAILDTLNIREGKRRRLLRDLYKNGVSERLSKALLAETDFEDVDDIPD